MLKPPIYKKTVAFVCMVALTAIVLLGLVRPGPKISFLLGGKR
jgi:hypothetical protein